MAKVATSVDDELSRIESTAGWLGAPWEGLLRVTGDDAARFLQNLLTQDIAALGEGQAAPAALANRKGHLEVDLWVGRQGDAFLLRHQRALTAQLTETFDRFRIVERVDWREALGSSHYLLIGPDARRRFADSGVSACAVASEDSSESSENAIGARTDRLVGDSCGPLSEEWGEDAVWMTGREVTPNDLYVAVAADRASRFETHLADAGIAAVGWTAFNHARIRAGRAWQGLDVEDARLVPEPGFDDRISYTKGCYLGQEPLARVHYRGQLNWSLARFEFAETVPESQTDILMEGKRVGWITSASLGSDGKGFALGYLHRKVRENPSALTLSSGQAIAYLP